MSNPYAGATQYVNPDYTTEVNTAIAAQTSGSTLAKQMAVVSTYSTAVWLDKIAAINGGTANGGRLGLQGHITAALAQQAASGSSDPIVVTLVIYDLPDRDCAALASNGELSIAGGDTPIGSSTPLTGTGLQEYENDFITPIYNILAQYESNTNIRFVLVVEDDSLPNMITNTGLSYTLANCVAANNGDSYPTLSMNGVYVQAIRYALNQFHSLTNVYNYLDVGHHGWLGWPANMTLAVPYFYDVAVGTTDGVSSIDGFITNTANYGPTKEPFMTATEEVGGSEVYSSTFYQWNPEIDEEDYAQTFYTNLVAEGFPSTIGFLIDTSRNGWGGSARPTAASTSTVLDTFVDATKIDERDDMGQWCNQSNAGIGVPPTVTPGYFANLYAYVWVKPPGESDGNYPGSVYNGVTSTTGDNNCNPAHDNALANNMVTDALANSPSAGTFWTAEFAMLVENAYPVIATTTTASFTLAPSSSTLSVTAGSTATDTVTVTDVNSFSGSVTLAASGLPTGVTAAFGTNPTTGSSVVTFTASSSATAGTSTVTITGTSGTLTETTTIALTVSAASTGSFTIAPSSSTLSVTPGSTATDTITVTDVNSFSGSVTLVASGLPTGVTATFGTNPTTGSSVITFTAGSSATVGTSTVTVTGTSGSLTATTTIALTVQAASTSFACHVGYTISSQWAGGFGAAISIENTSSTAITSWTLTWTFANGQTISQLWNGSESQSGSVVTVTNLSYNGSIAAGATLSGMGFNGTWNNTTNAVPTSFAVNGTTCQ
ncbi:glycoside hydrolase family 6 protein [Telmatobacter bradus]|uniref:glycoside hydrolase family 6 protein n=1 Tax=Telmatobacter bradus TaxID=474953 RepID=UPI003B42A7C4